MYRDRVRPWAISSLLIATFCCVSLILISDTTEAQRKRPRPDGEFEVSGVIRTVRPGKLVVEDANGGRRTYTIQDKDEDAITLGGFIIRAPSKINVHGKLPGKLVEPGMVIKFNGQMNRAGKSKGTITSFDVVNVPSADWILNPESPPEGAEYVKTDIIGQVKYLREKDNVALLKVPKTKYTRTERIKFKIDPASQFSIRGDSLNSVRKGDKVVKMKGMKFTTGEWVVREIEIEMSPDREKATTSFHDMLELKYSDLSDEPGRPRTVKSKHFTMHTDISDRQSQVLLAKLETMYELIGKYYGRLNPRPIECFVVRDLSQWQSAGLPPRAIQKIAEPAGVTISLTDGKNAVSKVYSCDNQGVVQHEAVHAICSQAFGTAGPTWYAEGMAEVGQYWKPGELEVNIDPVAVNYLTNAKTAKPLAEIVKTGQITGDSWEAYCWRWALCHMLANNPNYSRNFKKLGIAMMRSQEGATFEAAYGRVKKEIEFEYHFFCKNFDNGYRVDLCYFDWKKIHGAKKIKPTKFSKETVKAQGGWQATSVRVEQGKTYDYMNKGEWMIEKDGKALKAAGYQGGLGGMVGVIMNDYKLGKPFPLPEDRGSFVAPESGVLLLRCKDDWLELSDNEGEITTYFQNAK